MTTTDPSDLKTLFKIRTGRRGREVAVLFWILLGVGMVIGAVGALQVWFCLEARPTMTVSACLSPLKAVRFPLR